MGWLMYMCVCWPHVYQRQQCDSDSALNCFEIRSQTGVNLITAVDNTIP
jgi:hypothetical protein